MRKIIASCMICIMALLSGCKEENKEVSNVESIIRLEKPYRELSEEEKIIRGHSIYYLNDLFWMHPSLNIKPYLMVEEFYRENNIVIYMLTGWTFNKGDRPVKYTNYFKINDVYVFIREKDKEVQQISEDIQKQILGNGIPIETLAEFITINKKELTYKITRSCSTEYLYGNFDIEVPDYYSLREKGYLAD